jgi:hypothetical protein
MLFRLNEGENLVTYYLLPLVGVNKKTFGLKYDNSYINKEGTIVFIKLKSNLATPLYRKFANYTSEVIINNSLYIQFTVPEEFRKDVQFFIKGQYSRISREAKKIIYKMSTLPYNKTMGDEFIDSPYDDWFIENQI